MKNNLFFIHKNILPCMLCIGLVQMAAYYLAGMLASPDGSMAVPQPDTLLYCQAARRIAEGHSFSFAAGSAVSTGTTSVLYPFILAIPYLLGLNGAALLLGPWIRPEGMVCVVAFCAILALEGVWNRCLSPNHRLLPRPKTDGLLALAAIVSMAGVFALNIVLTGHAQFSSVANKGYFSTFTFTEAVGKSVGDFLKIAKCYFFGLVPAASARDLFVIPFLTAVFLWIGIFIHDWRSSSTRNMSILMLAACGGILTVAQSGWQDTNFDRYLVWTVPLFLTFIAEGAVSIGQFKRVTLSWLPATVCALFALGSALAAICAFHRNSVTTNLLRQFACEINEKLPPTCRMGSFGGCGIAYFLGDRPYKHLSGIYSPEFAVKNLPSVLTICAGIAVGAVVTYVTSASRISAAYAAKSGCRLAALSAINRMGCEVYNSFFSYTGTRSMLLKSSSLNWFSSAENVISSLGSIDSAVNDMKRNFPDHDFKLDIFQSTKSNMLGYVTFIATAARKDGKASSTMIATITFGINRSPVFDHAYFVNNYGWFNGSTITANGDVRANGDMSLADNPKINGDVYAARNDELRVIGQVKDGTGTSNDVVIKGYVTGQGTIYSQRNIHIVGDIKYVNPPTWTGKETNDANSSKDLLGLAAKGNIVMGDPTQSSWLNSTLKNCISTQPYVQQYKCAENEAYGTGDTRRYYDSVVPAHFLSEKASTITQIDAVMYNNHGIFGNIGACTINGALVCRNEGMIFQTKLVINWDSRLWSGSPESVANSLVGMPVSAADPEILFGSVQEVPNRWNRGRLHSDFQDEEEK